MRQAWVLDAGVRGSTLKFETSDTETSDLPLDRYAAIERDGATLSITVDEGLHPDCAHKGKQISFTCAGGAAEASKWQHEMDVSRERADGCFWGISKAAIREQHDRWVAEGERCAGMTVAEYFCSLGLEHIYDQQWSWCAGVLEKLEAKDDKSASNLKDIVYYKGKVNKTEGY